ncbi:hypothetical protein [Streptomyces californicus]|uniref:hypothetical protein n=1 Tax=Streptomyces californicus TaxID=67351 RepID=UPI000B183999|nr:hypothetical protein [Streptomyces californicus]QRV56638.1 hypothetical protein I6J40_22385 [Streptomyces californicus]
MSRRKKATEEPEETAPGPSRAAGGCVLAALVLGLGATLFAFLGTAAVLVVWAAGGTALWRAARSMPHAANPAPPPPPEGAGPAKPQFTIVEDRKGHCSVQWQKEGA